MFFFCIFTCNLNVPSNDWSFLVFSRGINMEIIGGSPSINYAYASRLGYITVDCPVTIFSPENSDQIVCIRFKSNNQLVLMEHKIKSCCKSIARNTSITHLTKTNSVVNTEDHFVWFVRFTFENCTKPFFRAAYFSCCSFNNVINVVGILAIWIHLISSVRWH